MMADIEMKEKKIVRRGEENEEEEQVSVCGRCSRDGGASSRAAWGLARATAIVRAPPLRRVTLRVASFVAGARVMMRARTWQ